MNKCCVKHIKCINANAYGVCRLSNAYDCKQPDLKEYEQWKKQFENKVKQE